MVQPLVREDRRIREALNGPHLPGRYDLVIRHGRTPNQRRLLLLGKEFTAVRIRKVSVKKAGLEIYDEWKDFAKACGEHPTQQNSYFVVLDQGEMDPLSTILYVCEHFEDDESLDLIKVLTFLISISHELDAVQYGHGIELLDSHWEKLILRWDVLTLTARGFGR